MDWKNSMEQKIESSLDCLWNEIKFKESLLDALKESITREHFLNTAMLKSQNCDVWIRDDVQAFIRVLDEEL